MQHAGSLVVTCELLVVTCELLAMTCEPLVAACGIYFPDQGSMSSALEAQNLSRGPPRKSPLVFFK